MTTMSQHAEWLSLIDISGPFLAEPVLKDVFPQGLEEVDPAKRRTLRQAYDEWREALDLDDPDAQKIHEAWIELVLRQGLELDEDGKGDVFKTQTDLPEIFSCDVPEHAVTLKPDFAVLGGKNDSKPLLLVATYDPHVSLNDPLSGDGWAASPSERMVELCRATDVRLGLITNGEQWTFIDAPVGAVTTFASWYARLWSQEPKTLQAFVNLLGVRRFFVDPVEQLPALLDESLKLQDEVTDALGEQVRRAVEVLVRALDKAHVDSGNELLKDVEPTELYEAGLTVMMRIVFLLSAEERDLLLLGDERYEANYAISTLRVQLRGESEEILERRLDAWARLLSIFRAVYGGIDHEALRLPALGGSLFDPDRFPFLEGRSSGSHWKTDAATPLPIDNRTVLLLLDAVQLFQGRTLSYRALDVEQIGYVYEGLLERTVVRAKEVTLDLDATKNAKQPWVTLDELEEAAQKGDKNVLAVLKERTGSSANRVKNDIAKVVAENSADKLLTACQGDESLRDRIKPYFHLLRIDSWGYPLVYPEGTFMVATGSDRRETGTHYTPKSLTEAIVKETLEPLVYVGPAEGKSRGQWQLKSPSELLDLKICDPAMGSGAFLVQVCRWLSERLVEAWKQSESAGNAVTSEGKVVEKRNGYEPLRNDPEERLLIAKRLIAERCLYGVDLNPLAVELAKLSIWLVTLAKGRPFGFLDHNFRSGDSLLGIHDIEQLLFLDIKPGKGSSKKLFASKIDQAVQKAVTLREEIRSRPIRDIRDIEVMAAIDQQSRLKLELPRLIADALVGALLAAKGKSCDVTLLSIEAGSAMEGATDSVEVLRRRAVKALSANLPVGRALRRPFHWPLEFAEVFSRNNAGFDAIVGNPPFLGGKRLSGAFGPSYQKYLVTYTTYDQPSSVDLVVHFFIKVHTLLHQSGCAGLLGRRSVNEAKNRDVGLGQLVSRGVKIYLANTNIAWPGKASVVVHQIHFANSDWLGYRLLDGKRVDTISQELSDSEIWAITKLEQNLGRIFQGTILSGEGFKIETSLAQSLLDSNKIYQDVVFPFIGGNEINKDPFRRPMCWAICFWDWPEEKARRYEDAYKIVEGEVKPERFAKQGLSAESNWWLYLRPRPELYHAIGRGNSFVKHPEQWRSELLRQKRYVIAISTGTTKYPAFTFLPSDMLYSNKLCVLADDRYSVFSVLSSDIHSVWAWAQKTTLQADMESLRYAHGNIFETFPFPNNLLLNGDSNLEQLGEQFFKHRQSIMESNEFGLTAFYNRFHEKRNKDEMLQKSRQFQGEINKAVIACFGWNDLDATTGFHEVGYLPRGKNVRFTLSETVRLEVLLRLSKLNQVRANEKSTSSKPSLPSIEDRLADVRSSSFLSQDNHDLFDDTHESLQENEQARVEKPITKGGTT